MVALGLIKHLNNSMKTMRFFAFTAFALVFGFGFHATYAVSGGHPEGDFCEVLSGVVKMTTTNFADIQGELNDEQTELEGEDVFNTTQVMPTFEEGFIVPTLTDGKKKVQFVRFFDTKDHADEFLLEVETAAKGCLTDQGFKYREDSGIEFFQTSTVSVEVMTSEDYDDEGNTVYKVLLQAYKR
jgi:hypothetical protein